MDDLERLKAENDRKQEELMQSIDDLGSSAIAWKERAERAESALLEAELARDGARATLDHQIRESAALRERVSALEAFVAQIAAFTIPWPSAGNEDLIYFPVRLVAAARALRGPRGTGREGERT